MPADIQKHRMNVYFKNDMLDTIRKTADLYGISVSRVMADAWEIAQKCKCKVPTGVIIFSEKRGMKARG